MQKIHLAVGLQIQNPNSYEIQLTRLDYRLVFEGSVLAFGSEKKPIVIPVRETSLHTLSVQLEARAVGAFLKRYFLAKEKLSVTWQADCFFNTLLGPIKIPFSQRKVLG